jgi:hypothetical protein
MVTVMNPRSTLPTLFSLLLIAPEAFAQEPPAPVEPAPGAEPPAAPAEPAAPPAEPAAPPAEPAEPAAPPAEPGAVEAPVAAEVPPQVPEETADEPPPPKKMHVGKQGLFQPSALLQGWFLLTNEEEWESTFRIRRAELKMKGEIIPELLSYAVMIDPAKLLRFESEDVPVEGAPGTVSIPQPPGDTSILQDFYITFLSDYAEVSLGQFKIPVSLEGITSSSKLIFPERALVSREFGDVRDLGVRVEKKFDQFMYMFGVFNGERLNRLDSNDQKDVSLRLEVYPLEWLLLGAVGYYAVGERDDPGTKDRVEGDVRVEIADVLFQAEYIRGWEGASGARMEGHGAYGALGYTFFDRLQPVVRLGFLDTDIDESDTEVVAYEVGLNYFIEGHEAKLQTSYSLFDPSAGGVDSAHQYIFSAQVSF